MSSALECLSKYELQERRKYLLKQIDKIDKLLFEEPISVSPSEPISDLPKKCVRIRINKIKKTV